MILEPCRQNPLISGRILCITRPNGCLSRLLLSVSSNLPSFSVFMCIQIFLDFMKFHVVSLCSGWTACIHWCDYTAQLSLSSPMVSNGYTSECSGPYWSNPPFLLFDIWAIWCSGQCLSAQMSKKLKIGGLDQYGAEHFRTVIFATFRKSVGLKRLNCYISTLSSYILLCHLSSSSHWPHFVPAFSSLHASPWPSPVIPSVHTSNLLIP